VWYLVYHPQNYNLPSESVLKETWNCMVSQALFKVVCIVDNFHWSLPIFKTLYWWWARFGHAWVNFEQGYSFPSFLSVIRANRFWSLSVGRRQDIARTPFSNVPQQSFRSEILPAEEAFFTRKLPPADGGASCVVWLPFVGYEGPCSYHFTKQTYSFWDRSCHLSVLLVVVCLFCSCSSSSVVVLLLLLLMSAPSS